MNDLNQRPAANPAGPGAISSAGHAEDERPIILSFVADAANIVSLLGLSIGVLAIFFALVQNYPAAIIAMLWAMLFDWCDGLVARATQGRSESHKLVGVHLDSLVDLVSSAVVPAILLLSVGELSAWFYPGALAIIMAGVLRLAYFDVFGVDKNGTVAGITIDYSPLVVSLVFLLQGFLSHTIFATLFYAIVVIMSVLHVAPFRVHKMVGRWFYAITAYVLVLTVVYSFILWAN